MNDWFYNELLRSFGPDAADLMASRFDSDDLRFLLHNAVETTDLAELEDEDLGPDQLTALPDGGWLWIPRRNPPRIFAAGND
ncbi:MAG: hypothetical protein LBP95_13335 [Deltaproteobacteria bacterium]|jgi:hypothetical protein|nr:hypothetical protein [Deltaproteobacteria bacterium]